VPGAAEPKELRDRDPQGQNGLHMSSPWPGSSGGAS
jgi:hypothetical protein